MDRPSAIAVDEGRIGSRLGGPSPISRASVMTAEALILEANPAAEALLGRRMVGHHWQEFVTPGFDRAGIGDARDPRRGWPTPSRFRMPRADGSLLEFDSYTEVDGEGFTTVMRPRE